MIDVEAYITRQKEWSERTFGPGARTVGLIKHIRSELEEIAADPHDIMEWVDVWILAADGAWRTGKDIGDISRAYLSLFPICAFDIESTVPDMINRALDSIYGNTYHAGWIFIMKYALCGARDAGFPADEFCAALAHKQEINIGRTWPDWRTKGHDEPIEHVR